jgi:hypothetical protein
VSDLSTLVCDLSAPCWKIVLSRPEKAGCLVKFSPRRGILPRPTLTREPPAIRLSAPAPPNLPLEKELVDFDPTAAVARVNSRKLSPTSSPSLDSKPPSPFHTLTFDSARANYILLRKHSATISYIRPGSCGVWSPYTTLLSTACLVEQWLTRRSTKLNQDV